MNTFASPGSSSEFASENPKSVVKSVFKAFKVLQAFGPDKQTLTINEAAVAADLDRGTAFRLIHTLVSLGYLRPVPVRRFRLTLKCLELGYLALLDQELRAQARSLFHECVPGIVDAASLGTLDNGDVVYLERVDSEILRYKGDRRPGRRFPAYAAALGHCMLAYLPEAEQIARLEASERIKLSERTLVELDQLMARLREVKARGYAISDGENSYQLRTVAAPVFDAEGRVVAGVSMTVDAGRMSIDSLIEIGVPKVLQVAADFSRALYLSVGAISL